MTRTGRNLFLRLGLLILTVVGLGLLAPKGAQAATLPTGTSLISTNSDVFVGPSTALKVPYTTLTGTAPSGFPTMVKSVAADNLSSTSRITDKTTEIDFILTGTLQMPSSSGVKLTSVQPDVTNSYGVSVATSNPEMVTGSSVSSVSFSSNTYLRVKIDVSGITLRNMLALYLGLKIKTSDGKTNQYAFANITTSANVISTMTVPTVTSTYTASGGGNLANVKNSDTKITGTAAANQEIWLPITLLDGTIKNYTTMTDASGKYTFDLGAPIGTLTSKAAVGVTQFNEMGDMAGATAMVHKVLDIAIAHPDIDVYPDDLTDNVTGRSDSEIIQWLVKAGGITVSDLGTLLDNDTLTFSADKSGLAAALLALKDGDSLPIAISAKNSAGTATDGGVTITVTKHDGSLTFGTISDFLFGDMVVPDKETLVAPTDANVTVKDTREAGSKWYVYANATALTDDAGHTVKGGLVYRDATGAQQVMTDTSALMGSGSRASGVTSLDAASNWATSADSKTAGLYLDVKPGTYSGDNQTTYHGTITWTLADTPA